MPPSPDFTAQPWWPRCIPLSQILGRIGTAEARHRYAELQAATSPHILIPQMAKHGDITTGLAAASDRLTTFRQVEDEQKRLVLAAVKQGALLAYGYQAPRRLEDQPVAVPLALWRQVVRWNTNEIEGEGLKIIGVRLISLRTVQSLCNDSPPAQDRGRPTREPEILAAYDTLIRSGIVKPDDTVKTKAAAIRAHVKSQHAGPDSRTDGLSDEAIRRALKSHPQSTKS